MANTTTPLQLDFIPTEGQVTNNKLQPDYTIGIELFQKSVREIAKTLRLFETSTSKPEVYCLTEAIEMLIKKRGIESTIGKKFYDLVVGKVDDSVWKYYPNDAVKEIMIYGLPLYLQFDPAGVPSCIFSGNSANVLSQVICDQVEGQRQPEDMEEGAYNDVVKIYQTLLRYGVIDRKKYDSEILTLKICAHFGFKRTPSPFSHIEDPNAKFQISCYEIFVKQGSMKLFEHHYGDQCRRYPNMTMENYKNTMSYSITHCINIIRRSEAAGVITIERRASEECTLMKWYGETTRGW